MARQIFQTANRLLTSFRTTRSRIGLIPPGNLKGPNLNSAISYRGRRVQNSLQRREDTISMSRTPVLGVSIIGPLVLCKEIRVELSQPIAHWLSVNWRDSNMLSLILRYTGKWERKVKLNPVCWIGTRSRFSLSYRLALRSASWKNSWWSCHARPCSRWLHPSSRDLFKGQSWIQGKIHRPDLIWCEARQNC